MARHGGGERDGAAGSHLHGGFSPDFGSTHHVEVRRSDGETSAVAVRVPPKVEVDEEDTRRRDYFVEVLGEDISIIRFDVVYTVRFYTVDMELPVSMPISRFTIPMRHRAEQIPGGWRLRINLQLYYETLRGWYLAEHELIDGTSPLCGGLGLFDVEISLTVGSGDWELPGGEGDP